VAMYATEQELRIFIWLHHLQDMTNRFLREDHGPSEIPCKFQ
jgi:hypothetical protein